MSQWGWPGPGTGCGCPIPGRDMDPPGIVEHFRDGTGRIFIPFKPNPGVIPSRRVHPEQGEFSISAFPAQNCAGIKGIQTLPAALEHGFVWAVNSAAPSKCSALTFLFFFPPFLFFFIFFKLSLPALPSQKLRRVFNPGMKQAQSRRLWCFR